MVAKIKDIFPTQFQRKQEEKWGRSGRQISTKKMLHRSTGKEVMCKSDTHARKGKQENSCIGLPENKSETILLLLGCCAESKNAISVRQTIEETSCDHELGRNVAN